MYGLVNQAIQGLVLQEHGDEVWQRIRTRAGVAEDAFLPMEALGDEITYTLVGAAAEELQADAGDLLEAFGEYWTLYVAEQGYGDLLDAFGEDLLSLLMHLDDMHSRIALSMPHLEPPTFRCVSLGERSAVVYYGSERQGLERMVVGLLRGCGRRFGLDVRVVMLDPGDEDVAARDGEVAFRIDW